MANETWAEEKATLILSLVKTAPTPEIAHKQVVEQLEDLVDRTIAGSKAAATIAANAKVKENTDKAIEADRAKRAERAAALGDGSTDAASAPARQSSHDYKAGERVTLPGGAIGIAEADGKSADAAPAETLVDGTVTWKLV